jgi:hypothetical protein
VVVAVESAEDHPDLSLSSVKKGKETLFGQHFWNSDIIFIHFTIHPPDHHS